jgi:hypothetical protein
MHTHSVYGPIWQTRAHRCRASEISGNILPRLGVIQTIVLVIERSRVLDINSNHWSQLLTTICSAPDLMVTARINALFYSAQTKITKASMQQLNLTSQIHSPCVPYSRLGLRVSRAMGRASCIREMTSLPACQTSKKIVDHSRFNLIM